MASDKSTRLRPVLGIEIARDAFVEPAVAEIGDIVRNHAPRDLKPVAELLTQHVDVADAVLEADDERALARVRANLFGGLLRLLRS